ncbi:DegQ family serine endoprotease [Oceanidesulfovibrio marinus]
MNRYKNRISIMLAVLVSCVWLMAGTAQAQLPSFTELAEKAGSAVVNINTVKTIKADQRQQLFEQFREKGGPFEDFFNNFDKFFQQRPRKQRSLGSGFIISPDGFIVTNNHVIAGADEVNVTLQGEKDYNATIVGRDPDTDLALLKIDAGDNLPTLKFGDSNKIKIGEWVVAIGNPFGLDHSVTAGIISAKGRIIGAGPYDDFLQTDASINPGNSGGPLLNMDGDVIGINTAIVAAGQGIGFAVPSSSAQRIIAQLKTGEKIRRGWLGVSIQNLDDDMAKALGLENANGALVANAMPGEPAAKAGVKTGDVILAVNGQKVEDTNELLRKIANIKPDEKARLTIWRNQDTQFIDVTLGERDSEALAQGESPSMESEQGAKSELGLSMRQVTDREAEALGLDKPQGLLITDIAPDSPAGDSDVVPGDVILEINQQPVNSVKQFESIVKDEGAKKGVVILLLKRRGQNLFRTIPLEK